MGATPTVVWRGGEYPPGNIWFIEIREGAGPPEAGAVGGGPLGVLLVRRAALLLCCKSMPQSHGEKQIIIIKKPSSLKGFIWQSHRQAVKVCNKANLKKKRTKSYHA